jgi:spore germination protein YaaH
MFDVDVSTSPSFSPFLLQSDITTFTEEKGRRIVTKRRVVMTFIIIMTFAGGFASGLLYSHHTHPDAPLAERTPSSAKGPQTKEPLPTPKVLIGYVQDFRDPHSVDYSKLTHAVFSFAHPLEDGQLTLNGETALTHLRTMVKLAHEQDTKAMLAVGGWFHMNGGESYDYFKAAISQPESRQRLVEELAAIAKRERLDGIDVDFEHPRSKADAQHLSLFTKELAKRLHANQKELSIAVYSKIHSVTGTEVNAVVFEPSMFRHIDYVNIMAYDGQWDGGYDAANLAPYAFTENIVEYWTNLFEQQDLSKDKLVLGVPFYAQPEDPADQQLSYSSIVGSNPGNAEQDAAPINGTMYHYNGRETIQRKTKLALESGFGGMMLWEAGHDADGEASLTSAIAEVMEQPESGGGLNKENSQR